MKIGSGKLAKINCGGVPSEPVHDHEPNHSEGVCVQFDVTLQSLLLCSRLQPSLREWVGAETSSLGAYDVKRLSFPLLISPLLIECRIHRTRVIKIDCDLISENHLSELVKTIDSFVRAVRNPATGDSMMLAPRKVVTFRSSGKLREKINR